MRKIATGFLYAYPKSETIGEINVEAGLSEGGETFRLGFPKDIGSAFFLVNRNGFRTQI